MNLFEQLKRPFPVDKVHWRVGATTQDKTSCIPLAYINARDVMQRLDDVVGAGNWQASEPKAYGRLIVQSIGIRVDGEWLWRGNGAGETAVEAEKGGCSDAFKRAAVLWGIGRYLYALPPAWVPYNQNTKKMDGIPPLPKWATPDGYDEIMAKRKQEEAK